MTCRLSYFAKVQQRLLEYNDSLVRGKMIKIKKEYCWGLISVLILSGGATVAAPSKTKVKQTVRVSSAQSESIVQAPREANDANRELVESQFQGLLAQGEKAKAQEYLKSYLVVDSQFARGWDLLAQEYKKDQKWTEAEEAFQKAADVSQGKERTVYLHGKADTQARTGDVESAKKSLLSAEQSVSGALASQIVQMRNLIRAGQPLPDLDLSEREEKANALNAFVALKAGYDTNVLLLSDDATATAASESALLNPLGRIEYALPFKGGSLSLQSLTSYTSYERVSVQNLNNLYQGLTAEWTPTLSSESDWSPVLGNRLDISLVNTSGLSFYSGTDTVYVNATKKLSEDRSIVVELPLGYQKFDETSVATKDERTGLLISPSLLMNQKWNDWNLNAGLAYSDVQAAGDNYKMRGYTLLAGMSRIVFWDIRGRLSLSYSDNWYWQSETDRKDKRYDVALNVSRSLPTHPNLNVSLDYILNKNESSLSTATYNRNTILMQVAYGF